MKPDLYAVLGVAPDASPEEIEQAVERKLAAAKDHNERVYLRHAKEVLGSPVSRAAYDTKLRQDKRKTADTADADQDVEDSTVALLTRPWVWLMVAAVVVSGGVWYQQHKPKKVVQDPGRQAQPMVISAPVIVATAGTASAPGTAAQTGELSPEAVYAGVAPSVVVIESIDPNGRVFATGSGVITNTQQVVTNCHVIQQAVQIRVRAAGAEYTASSGTSDTYLDLCMLQVSGLPGAAVQRGSFNNLRVGQTVYAVGAPQGLDQTLSQGLVSALREMPNGMVIQTSAAISPGSSGGGLFDSRGRLIGITTFQAKAGQNLNFAVPVDWIENMRTR